MRPFYCMIVLWGERHRRYFTDWCLPTFLASGNIPALPNSSNKIVIACPEDDWEKLICTDSFDRLSYYMNPVHLPFTPAEGNPCKAMGPGHQLVTQYAYEHQAYGIHLTPDLMISDGMLTTVVKAIQNGTKVLLTMAVRFSEEALIQAMHRRWLYLGQRSLAIPARTMAAIGMESLHPETQSFQWGASGFSKFPSAIWQPVENGMVCCSMSWAPILVDYGALPSLDTHALRHWTMDGDYIYRNFGDDPGIRLIQDTDDGVLISWTLVDQDRPTSPVQEFPVRDGNFVKAFGKWFNHGAFDPLKRQFFWQPVLWHPDDLTPAYQATADRLRDDFGDLLRYDWRRTVYLDAQGNPSGTLQETSDQYNERARHRT